MLRPFTLSMANLLTIESANLCRAGGKKHNEDACGIKVPEGQLLTTKGIVAAIADGMSGSDAGREASQSCVQGFLNDYFSTPESWAVKTSVHKILSALNHWLHGNGQRKYSSHKGMVTTLSSIVLKSNTAYLFHIGDTRVYRLRNGELKLLTHDHRVIVNEDKSLLTRAMGIDLKLDIDYRVEPLEVDDVFIMLTDGVYEYVSDENLVKLLEKSNSLKDATQAILDTAMRAGTHDNITCQLIKIISLPGKNEEEFYQSLTRLPFPPPLEPDMILDGYKILRHMFSNKRTEVYLAQDTETDQRVVLKAPSVNYDDDAEYINRFLHEEWAGRRINNAHVMRVLEIRRKRTALYYIAEHIEGRTLRQWMEDEPVPNITVVRDFAKQIASGLRAFHRMEMIHQDLKPENILIDQHGTLKIIDFGSTKISGIDEITTPIESNNLLGTINYTAPEYHTGSSGSNRSDIFSLGVITYELLTKHLPYGKELSARNIRRVSYRPASQFNPEIPAWVDKAIEKAVKLNPEFRYGHLSEFVYALSKPDSQVAEKDFVPLLDRNPAKVWRYIAIALMLVNIYLLFLLFSK